MVARDAADRGPLRELQDFLPEHLFNIPPLWHVLPQPESLIFAAVLRGVWVFARRDDVDAGQDLRGVRERSSCAEVAYRHSVPIGT